MTLDAARHDRLMKLRKYGEDPWTDGEFRAVLRYMLDLPAASQVEIVDAIAAARASGGGYADGLMAALMIAADFEGYASIDDITHGAPFDLIKQELDAAKRGEKRRSTPSPDAGVKLAEAVQREREKLRTWLAHGPRSIIVQEVIDGLAKALAAYASTTAPEQKPHPNCRLGKRPHGPHTEQAFDEPVAFDCPGYASATAEGEA